MKAVAVKSNQRNKSEAVANSVSRKNNNGHGALEFVDNRATSVTKAGLQLMIGDSPRMVAQRVSINNIMGNTVQVKGDEQVQKPIESIQKKEIIQRDVGMEYQTVGAPWNIKTRVGGHFQNLLHGDTTIVARTGFEVKNDFNDLEYITTPVGATTVADITTIGTRAQGAANYHDKLCSDNPPAGWTKVRIAGTGYNKITVGPDDYYVNREGQKTAHPQATVGVKLEKLLELAEKWSKGPTERRGQYRTLGWGSYGGREQREPFAGAVAEAKGRAGLSDKGKSFLMLVTTYVRVTRATGRTPNAKNAAAIMSRTDFASLLDLLPPADIPILDGILGTGLGRQAYFGEADPKLLKQGAPNPGEQRLAAWWTALRPAVPGTEQDILTGRFHGVSSTAGMKGIGGVPTHIGPGMQGAIVELRNIKRGVPTGEWKDIAEAAASIAKGLNA